MESKKNTQIKELLYDFINDEQQLKLATLVSYILLMITIFGFFGAVCLHLFPLFLYLLIRLKLKPIREQGLIVLLPERAIEKLVRTPIFDILCNIWFVPRASNYIKRFLLPFFMDINRKQAYKMFEEMSPNFAGFIKINGLANLLPIRMQKYVLGQDFVMQIMGMA